MNIGGTGNWRWSDCCTLLAFVIREALSLKCLFCCFLSFCLFGWLIVRGDQGVSPPKCHLSSALQGDPDTFRTHSLEPGTSETNFCSAFSGAFYSKFEHFFKLQVKLIFLCKNLVPNLIDSQHSSATFQFCCQVDFHNFHNYKGQISIQFCEPF